LALLAAVSPFLIVKTMSQLDALQQKFQRDINRCFDSDRNMRKRGLQKLCQDLPWNVMTGDAAADEGLEIQRNELKNLCFNVLYRPLLQILADPIEKCREHSIGIFRNIVQFCSPVDEDFLFDLINGLCARVNDLPFPEQGEELRLQIVELLQLIFAQSPHCSHDFLLSVGDVVFTTLGKGLQDSFPAAKRCWSEILISLSKKLPFSVLTHHKTLLKGLIPNCAHQHHKVRSVTIKALSSILSSLAAPLESNSVYADKIYLNVMSETVLPVLSRGVGDRSTGPRIAIARLSSSVISKRIKAQLWYPSNTPLTTSSIPSLTSGQLPTSQQAADSFASTLSAEPSSNVVDTELLTDLILLLGDPDETVRSTSHQVVLSRSLSLFILTPHQCLDSICVAWKSSQDFPPVNEHSMEVLEDSKGANSTNFLELYGRFVLDLLCRGVFSGWTTEIR
jgi:hypothetical protein